MNPLALVLAMVPVFLCCVAIALADELKEWRLRRRYRKWIERLGRERQ